MRIEAGPRHSYAAGDGRMDFHLSVYDAASSECLAEVELSPQDWLRLSAGSSLEVDGWVIDRRIAGERIGRRMENELVEVPANVWKPWTHSRAEGIPPKVREWAELYRANEDWDDHDEPRLSNSGTYAVVFRRWREDVEEVVPGG